MIRHVGRIGLGSTGKNLLQEQAVAPLAYDLKSPLPLRKRGTQPWPEASGSLR
ncbi:hypothetical protein SBDP1_90025 [Syntrophobacter sp. SbD1]|nr:hypothetical protein SBDP1_90025 [Syntrophobacter sp. SbD1]